MVYSPCYFTLQYLQHVLAHIRQINTREHTYEFAVTLESTTYVFECIQDVVALNIVYFRNFLFVKCSSQYLDMQKIWIIGFFFQIG
jgi:hypothetical protein